MTGSGLGCAERCPTIGSRQKQSSSSMWYCAVSGTSTRAFQAHMGFRQAGFEGAHSLKAHPTREKLYNRTHAPRFCAARAALRDMKSARRVRTVGSIRLASAVASAMASAMASAGPVPQQPAPDPVL